MSRVAFSTNAPISARNWGGRPAAFFSLLVRIRSTRSSSSVQSISSVSTTSRWFSSIGTVDRFERGNNSGCRLLPRLFAMRAFLPGHAGQRADVSPAIDPLLQAIDLPQQFFHRKAGKRCASGGACARNLA
jgi:hypothetical protein